jgi:hypothetical protein
MTMIALAVSGLIGLLFLAGLLSSLFSGFSPEVWIGVLLIYAHFGLFFAGALFTSSQTPRP